MKTVSGRDISFRASEHGAWLMTRDKGSQLREELASALADATSADTAVLDFSDVQAMTFSFADELVGKFLALREAEIVPPVGVVVAGLDSDPLETIELVVERRSQAVVLRGLDGARLLSRDRHLVESYDLAVAMLTFKASEIADKLGISPQNANNRLKKLSGIGALRRERTSGDRGGKEFSYRVVH